MSKADEFRALIERAHEAGIRAGEETNPQPMTVVNPDTGKRWIVSEGVCGFASIHFAGNTSFGRWAKREGIADRHSYYGGNYIPVREFGQSYERKRAYADAFADILNRAGIQTTTHARLD